MLKKSSLENTGEECPVLILRGRVQGAWYYTCLGGREMCTKGAMIHKVAVRKYGHERYTKGAHQQALMHAYVVQ